MKVYKTPLSLFLIFTVTQTEAINSTNEESITTNQFRAVGGPDAYGYIWADSDEVGGPVFNWIDITGIGTEVTGLADDNSVPLIPMGMDFLYYWITFSDIKIGSNGWLSFDNISNVASCFPTVPSAGGAGDNLIAPYMSDLNFTGAGNPGQVFTYYDSVSEEFIVSYINVPWWSINNPGFIGSNTFQVILSAVDSSITFQYLDVDQVNFNNNLSCAADLEIGFENNTGEIGLEILNEQVPADNYAVKISYPEVPLIDIEDPAPLWSQTDGSKGSFDIESTDIPLMTQVQNTGNADTTTAIDVTMTVLDEFNMSIFTETENLAELMAQEESTVNYAMPFNGMSGTYSLQSTTSSVSDLNQNNNSITSELNLISQSESPVQLSYVVREINSGSLGWNGGTGGAGQFFQAPLDGWQIDSIEMFIATGNGVGTEYSVSIYANDGGNGLPGTLLSSVVMADSSYTLDSWVLSELPTPVVAPDNGFFVMWEQNSNNGMALGTISSTPFSRQNIETLSGQSAIYRANDSIDFMIRVNMIDLIFTDGFE